MERSAKKNRTLSALAVIAVLGCLALSATPAAAFTAGGMELEFAGDTAVNAAGQAAVPVECIGEPTGFCSGTLTVSWQGERSVSTFSVRGSSAETVFVPLPPQFPARRSKLAAVATTSSSLGPPVTRKAILHLR